MRYESFKEGKERLLRAINDENEVVAVMRITIQGDFVLVNATNEYEEAWEKLSNATKDEIRSRAVEVYQSQQCLE